MSTDVLFAPPPRTGDYTMNDHNIRVGLALGLLLAVASGCDDRTLAPSTPATSGIFNIEVQGSSGRVDLLFVIDDSRSMDDEQQSLRREIPALVRGLTSPPVGIDGRPRWNAAESLRIAIVTSDMGTAGARVDRLRGACSELGGNGQVVSCDGTSIHAWEPGMDVDAFSAAVGACGDVGTSGCGIEQPLAASLAGLGAAGFPREDALLAVVVLSDEEDCSLADPAAFFGGGEEGAALNQRCVTNPADLVPTQAIVRGYLEGRDPNRFVFAALVGLPEDLVGAPYEAMLADSRMQYTLTDDSTLGVAAACERYEAGAIVGRATPGRRYIEVAAVLEGSLVASICADDYQPAIAELTQRIGGRVSGICVVRDLVPDADGAVRCSVRETLPVGWRCADLAGRMLYEKTVHGAEVCTVAQAIPGSDQGGWFYDVSDPMCEKISYTEGMAPPPEVSVALGCYVLVGEPVGAPTGA